jgi:Peptidase family C25
MSLQTHRLQPRRTGCMPRIRIAACLTALALALAAWAAAPRPARAAGTGTTALFMPQGTGGEVQFGDFITSDTNNSAGCATATCIQTIGLDTIYRYYVEVSAGLPRLRVSVYDADIGDGGAAEGTAQRDRWKHVAPNTFFPFSTFARYTLINPAGTQVASQTCQPNPSMANPPVAATSSNPFCVDATWTSLLDVNSVASNKNNFVLDSFGTAAYNNQNGNVNWSTNWTETNDDGSPTLGLIRITGGHLQISDNGDANPSTIQRGVALGTGGLGFTNAILTFNFSAANANATDQINVDVSSNNGTSFTTLETFTGTFATTQYRTYNITSFISNTQNTVIRFRVNLTGGNGSYNGRDFLVGNVQIQNVSPDAGHWEIDVDESTAVNPLPSTEPIDDINAFGLAADEGSGQPEGKQAPTELPIYYSAQTQIGQNLPASGTAGTKTYNLYPYITSGCSFNENDFDYDYLNGGAQPIGSITFTSPSTAPQTLFTKSLASASLSQNDAWITNSITGWTTDNSATDYGIWAMSSAITNYTTGGALQGNYANVEIANSNVATCTEVAGGQGCAPTDNAPTANTFRVYLPTDSLGTPVKPYMEQEVTYLFAGGTGGPNPPVVGQTTTFQVTVQVVNPTAHAITFSASNLVTVNVPGAGAVYAGSPDETQGTIVSQPATGGTGNITWNPGTVAANTIALLTYLVKVTPASAGQRIPVVGTVASGNGTKGTWVDETGNTTQTRATLTFGPLCELAATQGVITPVVVTNVRARQGDRGGVVVEWDSSSEVGTVAFDLLRWEPREARYILVNENPVPAMLTATQGGHYRVLDRTTGSRGTERYLIVEHVTTARRSDRVVLGPFDLDVAAADFDPARLALPEQGFDRVPHPPLAPLAPAALASEKERALADATIQGGGSAQLLALRVHDAGIYAVPAAQIASGLGLSLPVVQGLIASQQLRLSNAGSEIAWLPATWWAGESSGILFYGQAPQSIYTAENVYFLSASPGTWMSARYLSPAPPIPGETFAYTTHVEQETFAATVLATNPDSDYWYWASLIAGDTQLGSQTFQLSAEAANTIGQTANLQVNVQGASATGIVDEHQAQVSLNGTPIGSAQWTGATAQTLDLSFNGALLRPGTNSVQVTAELGPGVPYSYWYLQSFDLSYQRLYQTSKEALLVQGGGNPSVTVGGFAGTRVHVFDLTDPTHPVWMSGPAVTPAPGGGYEISFVPSSPQTTYLAASGLSWKNPDSIMPDSPIPLRNPFLGADVLIIAPQALLPAAQELASYRATQGFKTRVLDIQNIYDVMTGGLQNPHAIHDFLAYAHAYWNPAPRYVVLVGTGTLDYKNNLGLGGNLVPPLMIATAYGLFASDNAFADIFGTGIPDTAIGRLPVGTNADLHNLVQKIEAYEAATPAAWSSRAVLVSDSSENFANDSSAILGDLPPFHQAERIDLDSPPPAGARPTLLADLQSGVGLVNYVGHGGLNQLSSSGLLLASDAAGLTNGPRQPILTALTCTINRFEIPGFLSLGSAFVAQASGAAAAVWAPTGVSVSDAAKLLGQKFYLELGRGQGTSPQRLGDVIQRTLRDFAAAGGNPDVLRIYELLGDPALLVKPGAPPAAGAGGSSSAQE